MVKLLYKLFGIVFGLLGSIVAGALFSKAWKVLAHEDDAPDATDEEREWKQILPAVALKGAIAAVVKAVIHRGGAIGARGLTGTWPA